jgi:hypothetical protein
MKIEMWKIPVRIDADGPCIGDVYRAKGGPGPTRFYVIVALSGRMAHALGIDGEGVISSTTSYSTSVFAQREIVGRVAGLEELTLALTWEPI